MDEHEARIRYAISHTEVLRPPRQALATFGLTTIRYYLITEPVYQELLGGANETVIREGRVLAERPRIVTPFYLVNLFEGFQHGKEYAEFILRHHGSHEPGLMYRYKNQVGEMNIVSDPPAAVAQRLGERLDRESDPLTTIIKGVDEMWDVSLMKFIHDLTRSSLGSNVMELGRRGLLEIDRHGIPRSARLEIEELFESTRRGESDPAELKAELDRWNLFGEYEDRFLDMFRRGR